MNHYFLYMCIWLSWFRSVGDISSIIIQVNSTIFFLWKKYVNEDAETWCEIVLAD